MKRWLKTIAQIAVITGGVYGVPSQLPEDQRDTARDISTIAGIATALILRGPRNGKN